MKVLIEAINTPVIWYSDVPVELRIYANSAFTSSDGQWIPRGSTRENYLPIAGSIVGNVLTFPSFEIDSTVDSPDNPFALYTAEVVEVTTGRRLQTFKANFPLNTLEAGDPSYRWDEIENQRQMRRVQSVSNERLIAALITSAVGALNKSSETSTGVTALTEDPIDPTFPVAVSANDPRWLAIVAGTGLSAAAGQATLVNGEVTIPSSVIDTTKVVLVTSLDVAVTGQLIVPQDEIVDEASFVIRSTNLGDNGLVGWVVLNA